MEMKSKKKVKRKMLIKCCKNFALMTRRQREFSRKTKLIPTIKRVNVSFFRLNRRRALDLCCQLNPQFEVLQKFSRLKQTTQLFRFAFNVATGKSCSECLQLTYSAILFFFLA